MTDREPEEEPGEQSGRHPDPVNHHPPEEWRPGDPGDPIEGGTQPPGEPPHEFPHHDPHVWRSPQDGSATPSGQYSGAHSYGGPSGGAPPPGGYPPGEHPTGAPPEPVTGELSEGPSGPGQAGYEHAGYAPGFGESDAPEAGVGSYPPGNQSPNDQGSGPGSGYGDAGGYPPGQGYTGPGYGRAEGRGPEYGQEPGQGYGPGLGYGPGPGPGPGYGQGSAYGQGEGSGYGPGAPPPGGYGSPYGGGYGPPETRPTPWGKILGIGCGVLLLLLLIGGGCTAVGMFLAGSRAPMEEQSGAPGPGGEELPQTKDVAVTASSAEFVPSPLYTEGEFTSVDVSVTNNSEETLDVNPLYFSVVDAEGAVHSTSEAIGMDANELGAQTLAPGQSTSGTITVEGDFDVESVVFEPFYSSPVEVPVT